MEQTKDRTAEYAMQLEEIEEAFMIERKTLIDAYKKEATDKMTARREAEIHNSETRLQAGEDAQV